MLVESKVRQDRDTKKTDVLAGSDSISTKRKPGPQPARSERLCFGPVQSSPLLSALSFRRFADIQWPMSVMQSLSRAAVEAVSLRLQCNIQLRIISICIEVDTMLVDFVGKVTNVQTEQSQTKHWSLCYRTKNDNCARCTVSQFYLS